MGSFSDNVLAPKNYNFGTKKLLGEIPNIN